MTPSNLLPRVDVVAIARVHFFSLRRIAALFVLLVGVASVGFAQSFVAEWNASTSGGIGPTGLVLATEGGVTYLYAADQPRGRVIKFNTSTGAVVATFGQVGDANGELNSPYGLARDAATGDLYVAERGNNRISRLTNSGTFVMAWGSAGSAPGQFNEPIGVAVDAAGDVYVTDHGNNRVQKFHVAQSGGTWSATNIATWGSSGSANGQFDRPYGITADAAGNLWVADGFNGRVQRFNTSGTFQGTLGAAGSAPGQFIVATWVGLHPSGDLLVTSTNSNPQDGTLADAANQWVSRFTAAGTFVSRWGGGFGGDPSQFRLPFTAVVDAANRAYVSDYYNTRIQVFDLNSTATTGGTGTGGTGTGGTTTGGGTTTPPPAVPPPVVAPPPVVSPPTTTGAHVVSVTVPHNGTYDKGDEITFAVHFSAALTLKEDEHRDGDKPKGDDEDDDGDASVFFTWTGVGAAGQSASSGQVNYKSGSNSATWTFVYKVKNGDMAPGGIRLGTALQLDGATIRDAAGKTLGADALALSWPQNPLTGVVIAAPKPGNGNGDDKGKAHAERLVNLSSRLRVTGGDANRSVVAGFVVTGSAPKPILIRAVGPGLAGFGIKDALADPRLVLRDSTGKLIAENSGWNNRVEITVAGDSVGAFRLSPGSRDAALITALLPGAYTAQVTANGNGIVLVEVYDASTGTQLSTELIVNISTRGFVGTDDDVLVAGFVVTGSAPKRVLIRGIGPGLARFGVTGGLADPVLKLYKAGTSAVIAQNDNWETTVGALPTATEIVAATSAAGAFPLVAGAKDAAMVVTLMPGNYSAVVSGANNGTGAGLVEIYELP